jgi:hypothetical protein
LTGVLSFSADLQPTNQGKTMNKQTNKPCHNAVNAIKAGHVTSHIVRRKKDGLTHEEAKREAHKLFKVKTSPYVKNQTKAPQA